MPLIERQHQPSTSRLTTKGQVTIPAHIRRLLGIGPHDRVAFTVEQGKVALTPATSVVERTKGVLASDQPALSPRAEREEAEEAIAAESVARGGA